MQRIALCLLLCAAALAPPSARADVCGPQGELRPEVTDILNAWAQGQPGGMRKQWTLWQAGDYAQAHLVRPSGSERLSKEAQRHYRALYAALGPAQAVRLQACLAALGFLGEVRPPQEAVDYVLLNGSTAQNVRQRIHAVALRLEDHSLTLSPRAQVVFLDGERPLFASETAAVLTSAAPYPQEPAWRPPAKLPRDEREMNEMLWAQMQLPKALRALPVVFVHARKQAGAKRAETADCVRTWAQGHDITGGLALVVSNNPFIEYQRRVTEVLLAQHGAGDLRVAAMGPAAELSGHEPAVALGLLLDALGGALYRAGQQQALGLFDATARRAP